jgi:hypothetical protein
MLSMAVPMPRAIDSRIHLPALRAARHADGISRVQLTGAQGKRRDGGDERDGGRLPGMRAVIGSPSTSYDERGVIERVARAMVSWVALQVIPIATRVRHSGLAPLLARIETVARHSGSV